MVLRLVQSTLMSCKDQDHCVSGTWLRPWKFGTLWGGRVGTSVLSAVPCRGTGVRRAVRLIRRPASWAALLGGAIDWEWMPLLPRHAPSICHVLSLPRHGDCAVVSPDTTVESLMNASAGSRRSPMAGRARALVPERAEASPSFSLELWLVRLAWRKVKRRVAVHPSPSSSIGRTIMAWNSHAACPGGGTIVFVTWNQPSETVRLSSRITTLDQFTVQSMRRVARITPTRACSQPDLISSMYARKLTCMTCIWSQMLVHPAGCRPQCVQAEPAVSCLYFIAPWNEAISSMTPCPPPGPRPGSKDRSTMLLLGYLCCIKDGSACVTEARPSAAAPQLPVQCIGRVVRREARPYRAVSSSLPCSHQPPHLCHRPRPAVSPARLLPVPPGLLCQ